MNIEALIALISKLGFPIVVAVWFLWKVQEFMESLIVGQTQAIELLRQLVELHKP